MFFVIYCIKCKKLNKKMFLVFFDIRNNHLSGSYTFFMEYLIFLDFCFLGGLSTMIIKYYEIENY